MPPGEPLQHHLKKFFAADKKFGSKDRKSISSLCYNYYRVANAFKGKPAEEIIISSIFLCNDEMNLKGQESLNEKAHLPVNKKLAALNIKATDLFPFNEELSEEINAERFSLSFLQQPLVFIRMRPGKAVKILEALTEAKLPFEEISTSCIAMQPAVKADEILKLNKDAVVQDLSSQQVFAYLQQDKTFLPKDAEVWDCCAASGGKSILLYDLLHHHVHLTVSDIRENILHNLMNRFKDAGIKKYHSFTADITAPGASVPKEKYDLIICDVPCSGSGTWARTPEQLHFFKDEMIEAYTVKQKEIVAAALPALKKNGLLFYITCSVFKKENEDAVEYIQSSLGLQLLQSEYLEGYEERADTMFTAVFSR